MTAKINITYRLISKSYHIYIYVYTHTERERDHLDFLYYWVSLIVF